MFWKAYLRLNNSCVACAMVIWIMFFANVGYAQGYGQNKITCVLINAIDSIAIPYAYVTVKGTGEHTISDSAGYFTVSIRSDAETIGLDIAAIGVRKEIFYQRKHGKIEKVYVEIVPNMLRDFQITGLSAEEVVRRAISVIPRNYSNSSYFAYSTYRQYDRINGIFRNLIEATPVVMMHLEREKDELKAKEAFAIRKFWASTFFSTVYTGYGDLRLKELMTEDPVYHIAESSMKEAKLRNYIFWFDTTNHLSQFYRIRYISPFSSEKHGVLTSCPEKFVGEGTESGVLTIDRESFAFVTIERTAVRNQSFSYYTKPNLVIPGRKYFEEFVSGKLILHYKKVDDGDTWYLANAFHEYSNNFFRAQTGEKSYTITEISEWTLDSVSRYVDETLVSKFYKRPVLQQQNEDSSFFQYRTKPFYFFSRDSVYSGLR